MGRRFAPTVFALPLAGFAIACSTMIAMAQTAENLVGTWELVSIVNTAKDGTKIDVFGPTPKGVIIFGRDGHFAQFLMRPDLPKFASDNRLKGTPDENKAIVEGSIAYFGTYSVTDKVVTQHIEASTWPSWTATDQKRSIIYANDQITLMSATASIGGSNVSVWRRIE
jgi:Lipocalin-like domain